jgi:hypothetical protein
MCRRWSMLVLLLVAGMARAVDADPVLEPGPIVPAPPAPPRQPLHQDRAPRPAAPPSDLARLLADQGPVLAPGAWWIRWDEYRSLIVVDAGGGKTRPAWVATFDAVKGQLVVAYRAQASIDADGTLRISARNAVISGLQAWQWSPDSFLIGSDRQVTSFDDNPGHPANHGEVERMVDARKDADAYRLLQRQAQTLVGGAS